MIRIYILKYIHSNTPGNKHVYGVSVEILVPTEDSLMEPQSTFPANNTFFYK